MHQCLTCSEEGEHKRKKKNVEEIKEDCSCEAMEGGQVGYFHVDELFCDGKVLWK